MESPEPDEMVARARALVPVLATRVVATEFSREVSAETIAAFHQAGILRVLQPRAFGGLQGSFLTFSRIIEELAFGCAASAWVYAVLAEHAWIIACFPEQAQIDVWGSMPAAVASSSLAPRSIAQRLDGGYRLSGRYPFSSGSLHAQWAIIGALTEEPDDSRPTRYMLVPMQEIERIDDWNTLGLRGTGSQSLRLDDVFVPAYRTVLLSDLRNGTPPGRLVHPDFPLLRAPRDYLVPFSLPPVTFSLGRRALDMVLPVLRQRLARETLPPVGMEVTQMKLAESAAEIDMAVLILHTRRQQAVAAIEAGATISTEALLTTKRDIVFAQHHIRLAVERLCDIVGTQWVYDTSELQTILRDVLTTSTHRVSSWPAAMIPYGRLQLGLDPRED